MPTARRRWALKPKPSFENLAASAVSSGELTYERIAAELALVSIDGAIPEGLEESERMLVVLAGQLATMVAGPLAPFVVAELEDLREELDDLRGALREMRRSSIVVPTQISEARRHLVMFEVALRCFRNAARASSSM